jgi:hypothetical protein
MQRSTVVLAVVSVFAGFAGAASGQNVRTPISYSLDPTPHVTITNNYSSRLTGAAILVSNTVSGRRREIIWFDSGVNFKHDPPIEIGASRSFPVGPVAESPALKPAIMALTFEDGTTAGDSGWLSKLHARRRVAYDEILQITDLLNKALAQHESGQQIISSLTAARDSLTTGVAEPETRVPAGLVIYAAIANLERGGISGSVGDPQKTIPATILPIFSEWRGALKRYDKTIQ